MMTVGEAHQHGTQVLIENGFEISEARFAVSALLEQFTGIRFAHLTQPEFFLFAGARPEPFYNALDDLSCGVPLAYLLRKRGFFGLDFTCDERALIPRPETETLVENAIVRLKNHSSPLVADLGTGTGCVAIAIAHELPQSMVYATDASRDALELARANAKNLGVSSRIERIKGEIGSWGAPLVREGFAGKFDAVLSNPPYIASAEIETLQMQIWKHEPRAALDGGDDGLDCYRQIAAQCGALLTSGGFLMCELGAGQFFAVRAIFESHGWNVEPPILDLARIERVLCATSSG